MERVVGNSEYMFLVFQSLRNQACLQVEGCNFQHHLSHVKLCYNLHILYGEIWILSVQFTGFSFQLNSLHLGKCHICFLVPVLYFFNIH